MESTSALAPQPVPLDAAVPWTDILEVMPGSQPAALSLGAGGVASLVMIDGFYRDPERVRSQAVSQLFFDEQVKDRLAFPGYRSYAGLSEGIVRAFSPLVRAPTEVVIRSTFQFCPAERAYLSRVHTDSAILAGVLYLNRDHQGEPGTSLYRHKQTGICAMTRQEMARGAAGLGITERMMREILVSDMLYEDRWEELYTVPIAFNRLIIYPGFLFHRNASAWGTSPDDSRLVQAFFVTPQ